MCLVAGLAKKGDRNVPGGLPKKRRPDSDGAVHCSENSVKPGDWHFVVLGGILGGTWWNTWQCLVEYLAALGGAATFNVGRASNVAQSAFQQPAQSVDTTNFENTPAQFE